VRCGRRRAFQVIRWRHARCALHGDAGAAPEATTGAVLLDVIALKNRLSKT
jgi:hypothetical protein